MAIRAMPQGGPGQLAGEPPEAPIHKWFTRDTPPRNKPDSGDRHPGRVPRDSIGITLRR